MAVSELFCKIKKNMQEEPASRIIFLNKISDSFEVRKYFPDSVAHDFSAKKSKKFSNISVTFKTPEDAERASKAEIEVSGKKIKIDLLSANKRSFSKKAGGTEKLYFWKLLKKIKVGLRKEMKCLKKAAEEEKNDKKKNRLEMEVAFQKSLQRFLNERDTKLFLETNQEYYKLREDCVKVKLVKKARDNFRQILQAQIDVIENFGPARQSKAMKDKLNSEREFLEQIMDYFEGNHDARDEESKTKKKRKADSENDTEEETPVKVPKKKNKRYFN